MIAFIFGIIDKMNSDIKLVGAGLYWGAGGGMKVYQIFYFTFTLWHYFHWRIVIEQL